MTKEITKAFILQEIEDRFKLREFEPDKFLFSELVVPTYNIDRHLYTWEVVAQTESITSATFFTFFTVPADEEWLLRSYMMIFGMTGAHKASGVLISMRPTGARFIYLDLKKNQEISYLVNLPVPVTLQAGNKIKILIDTYVSTQDLTLYMDVRKEKIR